MMRIGSLFSGYGGLDLAVETAIGGTTVWHVDNDPAATALLAHHYPHTPNLGDITTVDWHRVAAEQPIDVLCGGFPCTDVSAAGRRAGLTPTSQSGLWTHMARAIAVLRPNMVVIENVAGLHSALAIRDVEPDPQTLGNADAEPVLRAAGAVLGDLASLGFDAEWATVRASDVGAPHQRARVFLVAWPAADTEGDRRHQGRPQPSRVGGPPPTDAESLGRQAGGVRVGTSPTRPGAHGDRRTTADATSAGRQAHECGAEQPRQGRKQRSSACSDSAIEWGDYAPAVERWAAIVGREAPEPTVPGRRGGNPVLSAQFVEWMQGLPAGWVTDVDGLSRNDQLRLLGNGVVPQQAAAALRAMIDTRLEAA